MSALDDARSVLRDSGPRFDVQLPSPTLTRMWWDLRKIIAGLVKTVDAVLDLAARLEPQAASPSALEEDRMWVRQQCAGMIRQAIGSSARPDPAGQVEAVMEVLAPWADGVPGVCERVRYPLIRFEHEGTMVMPSDEQVRMVAEQIVTAIRTGTAP